MTPRPLAMRDRIHDVLEELRQVVSTEGRAGRARSFGIQTWRSRGRLMVGWRDYATDEQGDLAQLGLDEDWIAILAALLERLAVWRTAVAQEKPLTLEEIHGYAGRARSLGRLDSAPHRRPMARRTATR